MLARKPARRTPPRLNLEALETRDLLATTLQLLVTQPTNNLPAGGNIGPVTVRVAEAGGATSAGYNGPVSVRLGVNAAGANLIGTTTVNAVAGVAKFTSLGVDKAGTGFVVVASAPVTITDKPDLGLAIEGVVGGEIPVAGFDIQVTNQATRKSDGTLTGAGASGSYTIEVSKSAADPGFLAAVAKGTTFKSLTLTERDSKDNTRRTVRLDGPRFTAWSVNPDGGGQLVVTATKATDTLPNAGKPIVGTFDDAKNTAGVTGTIDTRSKAPPQGLLAAGGPVSITNEIPVEEFQWAISRPATRLGGRLTSGTVDVGEYSIRVGRSDADPALLAAAGSNRAISALTLSQRDTKFQVQRKVEFTNAFVTAWQASEAGGGILTVAATKITDTVTAVSGSGVVSNKTASVSVTSPTTASASGVIVAPAANPANPSKMGLVIDGVDGEIEAAEYSWAVSRSISAPGVTGNREAGAPQVGEFTITLNKSTADAGFLAAVANGTNFPTVTLLERTGKADVRETKLENARFTTWHTSNEGGGAVTIAFDSVKASSTTVEPDGSETKSSAEYSNAKLIGEGGSAKFTSPAAAQLPAGRSLAYDGISKGLEVESFDWAVTNGGTLQASAYTISVPRSVADLTFLGAALGLAGGGKKVTVTTAATSAGGALEPVRTITTENTLITDWLLTQDGLSLGFDFTSAEDTVFGTTGNPIEATVDLFPVTVTGTLVAPAADPQRPPQVGLTIAGVAGEVPVTAFGWTITRTATRGTDGKLTSEPARVEPYQITVENSKADPGFLAAVARGQTFTSVTLRQRTGTRVDREVTLTNAKFVTRGTLDSATALEVTFAKVTDTINVVDAKGTKSSAAASFDGKTAVGNVVVAAAASPLTIGLASSGFPNELPVTQFAWQIANDGRASAGEYQLTVSKSSADVGLLAAVARGDIATLTLSQRQGSQVLRKITLEGGRFTGWSPQDEGGGSVAIAFDKTTDKVYTLLPGGKSTVELASASFDARTKTAGGMPVGEQAVGASGTFTVVTPPLRVESVTINGGRTQRSNIETIAVRFNQATNAQQLINSGAVAEAMRVIAPNGSSVPLDRNQYRYDATTNTLTVDVTQDGFGPRAATRLVDGRFQLRLSTPFLMNQAGTSKLVDDDGTSDNIRRTSFHRLRGDFNGDTAVTAGDLTLIAALAVPPTRLGSAKYDFGLDLNADSVINTSDVSEAQSLVGRRV